MRGATYADARIVSQRSRALTTKNGKVGSASDAESEGMSVRVLADGAWGFAASEDLSRSGVEATAARAVEIALASAQVKQHERPARSRKVRDRRVDYAACHRSIFDFSRAKYWVAADY